MRRFKTAVDSIGVQPGRKNAGKAAFWQEGVRRSGGKIWLSAQRWLGDSGMATAAEIGVHGPKGEWLIEGHGVDPDIVVDHLLHALSTAATPSSRQP